MKLSLTESDNGNNRNTKLSCYFCGRARVFAGVNDAFASGWDCPEQIVLCANCGDHRKSVKMKNVHKPFLFVIPEILIDDVILLDPSLVE